MSRYIEKAEEKTLPLIPTRALVAFPSFPLSIEIERDFSISAFKQASNNNSLVLLVCQKDPNIDNPTPNDLYNVGTICEIKKSISTDEGIERLFLEPMSRANIISCNYVGDLFYANVIAKSIYFDSDVINLKTKALMHGVLETVEKITGILQNDASESYNKSKGIKNPGQLADFIASNLLIKYEDKQTILEEFEPENRLESLLYLLEEEHQILKLEYSIHKRVREGLDERQKEYYLREQQRIISEELGDSDDELSEYAEKIEKSGFPNEIKAKLNKELSRLQKFNIASPDSAIYRNYLDICLDIPFSTRTEDTCDIKTAKEILDKDHYGLNTPKERILEFLAVKQLNPKIKNQILCFVGPPGTGKTSLAISIAKALNRNFERVSLGGIRDEAEIRGHRKTYVAAMPGRIIKALIKAKSMNPVICLDEIDKLCSDMRGDPAAAMLEVLDSEQNHSFRDHFLEIECDLSEVMFIATANDISTIPPALLDRMEVIELNTYTKPEKIAIAKNHLIPKQLVRNGLNKSKVKIKGDALSILIDGYTCESGVRNLERELSSLFRKCAKIFIDGTQSSITISSKNISNILGPRKFLDNDMLKNDSVGIVNGLAYTSVGGDVLKVESSVMPGSGKLELTGTLGDVMKESAKIAYSYIRSNYKKLGISEDFYKNTDIHLHVPEGAVPKDGPSAGVTILSSFVSALTSKKAKHDYAMTGEISLTGRVLPIGGLKEKSTAAWNEGIKYIILPKGNTSDIEKLDVEVKNAITFLPVSNVDEVLNYILT